MRNAIVKALQRFKWRALVPAIYWLGLPHDKFADALRLAPIKKWLLGRRDGQETEGEAVDKINGPGSEASSIESRFPGPARLSIHSVSSVAGVCRVLREDLDDDAVERYVAALIKRAPQHEPDIRWGRFLAELEEAPITGLCEGERLLAEFPLSRLRRSLYQKYNQVGNVSRSLELSRAIDQDQGEKGRTTEILEARKRMLGRGVPLPSRQSFTTYKPKHKRTFYLLHNSLPHNSGGYATRTHGLVSGMRDAGWDVECATRLGYPEDLREEVNWIPPTEKVDGVRYHRLKDDTRSYRRLDAEQYMMANAEAVLALARKRKPVLIHGASNHINGVAAAYAARKLGLPSVYEVRGLWELTRISRQPEFEGSELFNMIVKLETQACLETDAVITLTQGLKDLMIHRGVPSEKIAVVPNGVDTERFQPTERDDGLADELGVGNRTVLGYIGSMPQYEGLDDLLHAVAMLPASARASVYLLLVGDGDQYKNLRALRDGLGLQDCVHFTGRVPFELVDRLYSIVDVAVFPRKPQPVTELVSPMKPFEAMAMGKPILASNVDALSEIVSDGQTGILFKKGCRDSLSEAIGKLLEDNALTRQIGEAGREWVQANRDWKMLGAKAAEIYQEVTVR